MQYVHDQYTQLGNCLEIEFISKHFPNVELQVHKFENCLFMDVCKPVSNVRTKAFLPMNSAVIIPSAQICVCVFMLLPCCSCNGRNVLCKQCVCVRSGHPCVSCLSLREDLGANTLQCCQCQPKVETQVEVGNNLKFGGMNHDGLITVSESDYNRYMIIVLMCHLLLTMSLLLVSLYHLSMLII